jgi:hypothetical protein
MKLWYQICPDYNLKCYRLYVQDGIYGKDLGALTGTPEAIDAEVLRRLQAHSFVFYKEQAEWVKR